MRKTPRKPNQASSLAAKRAHGQIPFAEGQHKRFRSRRLSTALANSHGTCVTENTPQGTRITYIDRSQYLNRAHKHATSAETPPLHALAATVTEDGEVEII